MLKSFQDQLDQESGRTQKPRKTGITMVLVFDVAHQGPKYIEPYQELVDRIKLLDTLWHHDFSILEQAIAEYRKMDMHVALGGSQYEIAKAQGKLNGYLDLLKKLGINEVEVENHGSDASLEELTDEIKRMKDNDFQVIGEVGKKWWWKDPTRKTRDLIHVDRTIEQITEYLKAGADYIYWEGMIVRNLIGTQLENEEGQEQFRQVVQAINSDRLIFEIWDARSMGNDPIIAYLVSELGPNVNLANIFPPDVKYVEWIRHGIIYEMDHPYMRWAQDRSHTPHWWKIDPPDYSVDMQRNFQLKDFF